MDRGIATLTVLLLSGSACAHRPHSTAIAHPAVAGRIDEHAIEVRDPEGDRGYRIGAFGVKQHSGPEVAKGTLTDRVRLVQLDGTAICFDFFVVARRADAPEFQAPNGASIVGPKGHDAVRPSVEPKRAKEWNTSGLTAEHLEAGPAEYAGDDGYRLVRNPKDVVVYLGGAKICFANEGIATPQTREIRLHTSTGDYAWELQGSASAWPAESIVYNGKIPDSPFGLAR